jgi:Excalibur calcium-binding domain
MKQVGGVVIALLFAIPALSAAHSGGTDKNGCHTNKKTGEYHCHTPKQAPVRAPAKATPKKFVGTFVDKNCKDFRTQREAQDFFIQQGGPYSDPHRLDADKDGKACEELK